MTEKDASSVKRTNLLFVMGDQWRRHSIGCMGQDPVVTPHFDRFAAQGVLFENAFSCSPICTPNRAALLTGKHPFSLNMMHNWLRLPVEEETIATAARRQGYATGWIGKWHLDAYEPGDIGNQWNNMTPRGQRRMGFDYWLANNCNHNHFTYCYMDTDEQIVEGEGWQVDFETDMAIRYLENEGGKLRDPDKPFCLYLSWSPPHNICGGPGFDQTQRGQGAQFRAPERFEALYPAENLQPRPNTDPAMMRRAAPGHFGAITSMDENFGRLMTCLERLGLADDTIVVVASDHGENLGSHGLYLKDHWYEESVGIPFIIRLPGVLSAGRREAGLFNSPDVMPTLLGLMGCEVPLGRHGRDFSAHLRESRPIDRRTVFMAHECGAPYPGLTPYTWPVEYGRAWRAVRDRRYTYVALNAGENSKFHDPNRFPCPFPQGVTEALYDLHDDPYQQNPILPGQDRDEDRQRLRQQLKTWLDELGDPFLDGCNK